MIKNILKIEERLEKLEQSFKHLKLSVDDNNDDIISFNEKLEAMQYLINTGRDT